MGTDKPFACTGSAMLRGPDAQRIYAGQRTSTVCQPAKSSVLLTGLSKPSPAPRGTEACKVGRERAALSRAKDRCLCAASQQDVQVRESTATATVWPNLLLAEAVASDITCHACSKSLKCV